MPHLLSITDLNRETMAHLLERAQQLLHAVVKPEGLLKSLNGKMVANLFFEPSTRTQYSFSIAARRLGASVLDPVMSSTSTVKGESVLDTLRTFIAMGSRLIVLRHKEEKLPARLAHEIGDHACIINGGDGCHQHPTQGLLDLLTIQQYKHDFSSLKVAIMGDVAHSRVARSLVEGLSIMGCTQINLVAPPAFLPADKQHWPVTCYTELAAGLSGADVVVVLRIQHERITGMTGAEPSIQKFQLNAEHLRFANPHAIVMHPGPMNRGIEITDEVADGPQSVILQQVSNGVAVRMAVMEWLMGSMHG